MSSDLSRKFKEFLEEMVPMYCHTESKEEIADAIDFANDVFSNYDEEDDEDLYLSMCWDMDGDMYSTIMEQAYEDLMVRANLPEYEMCQDYVDMLDILDNII